MITQLQLIDEASGILQGMLMVRIILLLNVQGVSIFKCLKMHIFKKGSTNKE